MSITDRKSATRNGCALFLFIEGQVNLNPVILQQSL
uniref:Uncharacterized protein n=1 Tax=Myoviridae sp. ctMYT7 TaxID=2825087 RepID=A0A8S5Q408_9CAUD|nr:MAG TPA: hypothetical protein [Myoviridae sp. ctMYT7]